MKKVLLSTIFVLFGFSLNFSTDLNARHGGGGAAFGGALAGSMVGGLFTAAATRPSGRGDRDSWRRYAQDLEDRNRRLQRDIDDLRDELRRLRGRYERSN